jgi:S-adenosylmethionine decarboxylase
VVVIAESHFTIHTWPEYQFAAADFFTCGQGTDPDSAIETLRIALKSDTYERQEIPRGKISSISGILQKKAQSSGKSKKTLHCFKI